ncbi:hypothetical protein C8F04DRAFT_1274798 [Mycena alexandri]|uniref:Uncharacterized protein n=1 Tax=Mycena alexandri TaxID=1745969 RepID=A0AAD6WN64_9AGAR|nr:hypothetical protein C8F04DRAFT_1274798 [Mycena alexandri]
MARTKQVCVRADRIPPPGGWPAHVQVLPDESETDGEDETDDAEDDVDVDSQDADEDDSAEEGSDVKTDSDSQPGELETEDVEDDGGVEGEDIDGDDSSLSSLSSDDDQPLSKRFLTERFDGAHVLTTEEVAVLCGVSVESLPHASSLPPLFCASLALCSDFGQSFTERFPGVKLITAEEFSLICGVNVGSLAHFSTLPPLFGELGRPFSEHNSALRLYNASEAAFLCGSSLDAHSSSLRQEVAASDEQRRRADATRTFNAAQRQLAIASPTRRRSSRFKESVGRSTPPRLDSISTVDTAKPLITTRSSVKSSPSLVAEATLPLVARAAALSMDLDAETFFSPATDHRDIEDTEPLPMDVEPAPQSFITSDTAITTPFSVKPPSLLLNAEPTPPSVAEDAFPAMELDEETLVPLTTDRCEIQDPESPSMDVEPALQSFVTLWPHAMPLEKGMLSVFARPYNVIYPVLMIYTLILLRLQAALREAQLFSSMAPHILASMKAAVEAFWDFDNRLFNRISDWCLDHNVNLLGSGLIEPPVVIIANNPFIDDARAFASAIIVTGSRVNYLVASNTRCQ